MKTLATLLIVCVPAVSQSLNELARSCAPRADISSLAAIIKTESSFHPYVLSINRPVRSAQERGLPPGKLFLDRQPTSRSQAYEWGTKLLRDGYTLSVGLMQVSTESGHGLGALLDPCQNIAIGWPIFESAYRGAKQRFGSSSVALLAAISFYNSGSYSVGLRNGYVGKVIKNARGATRTHSPT
jgi:type IV secretion system protein VirB1